MGRKTFLTVYKEYGKHYAEKGYEKCMDLFPKLDLKANYLQYKEQVEWVLRSASHSLSLIKNPKNEHKVTVANAFNEVFSQISTTTDYVNFFSILISFTDSLTSKGLESYLPLFTGLSSCGFDSKSWLQNVNVHLFKTLQNANIIDDTKQTKQKEIYLQLSCTLLYFVNVESQRTISMKKPWQFNESQRFLKNCTEFPLFQNGDKQYSDCFKLLSKFLECLCTKAETNEFADSMEKFLKSFKQMVKSKEARATLVRDIFAVLTRATKICEQRFDELLNIKNCAIFIDFMAFIGNGIIQSKTEKRFLCRCDDTNIHLSHDITTMVVNKFIRLMANGPDTAVAESVGTIIRVNFEAISKLTCANTKYVQVGAVNLIRNLMKTCENKEIGRQAVLFLKSIIKRFNRIKLMKEVTNFEPHHILSHSFKANSCAENWDDAVNIGFLLLAFMSVPEPMPTFEHTAWTLAKLQKEQNNVKSPFEHFNKIDSKSLHGFTLPDNFSVVKLSLAYLKIGIKYGVMSTELSNKIIHQLLMSASYDDFSPMRFVFFTQSMNFDRITTERVEKLTNAWQIKEDSDRSIGLQLAAIKYNKFNYDANEWTEKYKNLHISQALSEEEQTLETSVFKEMTFDREKKQITTLRFIKKKIIEFTKYYINASEAEQKLLNDEKDYLLRELKMVANQFIVRGYIDDGLDLYMALYEFSITVDDEFGLIDSCSVFAESSAEFKQKFPSEDLKKIIEGCFSKVISKLKVLKDLSTRKQNQVGFCMLNLVLFYHEDDGDRSKEIYTILKFIFTSIGGVRDKNMGDCLKATTGTTITVPNVANGPNINSEAVRIKFYTVLFSMVTKYNARSTFSPCIFLNFVMEHIRKYLNVYSDSTIAVPILLFNIIPQMVTWLHSTYEVNTYHQSLVLTLLKLAIRSGYAHRATGLLITLTQANLLTEDLKYSKTLFIALESIILSPSTKTFTIQKDKVVQISEGNSLCEPIRKQGLQISPMKNATPSPARESQINYIKFLRKHPSSCDCGICFSPETVFQRFCTATVYARYVYLNDDEFSNEAKRTVFKELFTFWDESRNDKNKFPRADMFYVMSARMLLYTGHHYWKDKKDWDGAVTLLKRGLKGLGKVKYGACLIKQDLELQIKHMEADIKERQAPRERKYIRIMKQFDDEVGTKGASAHKSDDIFVTVTHDPSFKPIVKKPPSRNRLKQNDEIPARTPSHQIKPTKIAAPSKSIERPKRNLIPTIFIDLDSDSESTKDTTVIEKQLN